jgi:hypothetical protein
MCGADSGVAQRQQKAELQMQKQSFDMLQQRQNQVGGAVGKYLSGNVGFDPQQLALMKSQFLNQNAAQYNQAGRATRTALLRSGSADSMTPAGGDYVRGISGLEGGMANNASSGIANINLQNLQQALNNKFNAASLINGQAAQLTSPISSFGQDASSALNSYITAANSGFGATLGRGFANGLGSAVGSGIGAFATGGFGSLGSMLGGGGKG